MGEGASDHRDLGWRGTVGDRDEVQVAAAGAVGVEGD
jgi:hypothetical protein